MRYVPMMMATLLAGGAANAQLPETLLKSMQLPTDGPDYTFDISYESIDEGDDPLTLLAHARYDPTADEFKQLTPGHLIDPSLPGSPFRALSAIEGAVREGVWCSRFLAEVPDDMALVAEDADTVTYEFEPEPPEDARGAQKKIFRRSTSQLTLAKSDGAVLAYQRVLDRTVTIFVIAKIRQADETTQCARAPDGRTYVATRNTATRASGGGQNTNNRSESTVTLVEVAG